ncbi:MAG: ATP-binding protein [Actinomycetota bacterium]
MPWSVANRLLSPDSPLPHILNPLTVASSRDVAFADGVRPLVSRLSSKATNVLRIVPIRAPKGSAHLEVVQGIAEEAKREVVEYRGDPSLIQDDSYLNSLVTSCWLAGKDLFLDEHVVSAVSGAKEQPTPHLLREIPATVFLGITERSQLAWIPDNLLAPIVEAPALSYPERVEHWRLMLGTKAGDLDPIIAECSRRFRYGKSTIEAVAEGLKSLPKPITNADFLAACRAELALDISSLAREVVPRFEDERLILPRKQDLQFRELVKAVRSLTEVHYGWGTARIWNEVGISALFAGPPGTGKTMAAEILARELELPMYRIDLSQVVNKYIGETEKNLKQLFDAADVADIILFFDEADSLFGRRTEVRDAHDRYANLEVSYLLERMERFKGVAILATNRKQDLDEAFLRRLRFIVDFPSPGMEQREEIWRQLVPDTVDTSQLDFDFLARRFDLTGGHINSIVFYACLQGADGPASLEGETHGRLTMENIVIAVKREYEKSNRSVSLEHFGPYAEIIERTEYEDAER